MNQFMSNLQAEQTLLETQIKNTETIRRLIEERDRYKCALAKIHRVETTSDGAMSAIEIADKALYGPLL